MRRVASVGMTGLGGLAEMVAKPTESKGQKRRPKNQSQRPHPLKGAKDATLPLCDGRLPFAPLQNPVRKFGVWGTREPSPNIGSGP